MRAVKISVGFYAHYKLPTADQFQNYRTLHKSDLICILPDTDTVEYR